MESEKTIQRINGTLKKINENKYYYNITIEFKYDFIGAIKNGKIIEFNDLNRELFGYYSFKNEDTVIFLYVNQINIDNTANFQSIRYKGLSYLKDKEILTFFITKTDLIHGQNIHLDNIEYALRNYIKHGSIELKNLNNLDLNLFNKIHKSVDNILLYIQLVQLNYCKVFGYSHNKCIYVNYSLIKIEPFEYNKSPLFQEKEAENVIAKLEKSLYKKYILEIIYRLIVSNLNVALEIKYIWLIFAFEGIVSIYNKKLNITNNDKLKFNNIVDIIIPDNDLMKIYYANKEEKNNYWKSILWIYRDKYAHFLENSDELKPGPISNQQDILDIIFKNEHRQLLDEFKKCLKVAQILICFIIDVDYKTELFKLYE